MPLVYPDCRLQVPIVLTKVDDGYTYGFLIPQPVYMFGYLVKEPLAYARLTASWHVKSNVDWLQTN